MCPAAGGKCTQVSTGGYPKWDADGSKIYFWRWTSLKETGDLWRHDLKTHSEKQLGTLGPFYPVESFFDVSRAGQAISTPFHEGRTELWLADLKR